MKINRIYLIIFLTIFSCMSTLLSQWFPQSPAPQGNDLISVQFINSNIGWAVSNSGTILKTTNGGLNWMAQVSGTFNHFSSVYFANYNEGWVVGVGGIILYTPNEGILVELTSFTAEYINDEVFLKWQTATETNNQGFEIEKKTSNRLSSEADPWEQTGYAAGKGTTTEITSYIFNDKIDQSGNYLYGFKQIDFNGSFEYSQVIEIEVSNIPDYYALEQNYPHPFNPSTTIRYAVPVESKVSISIFNLLGQEIIILVNGVESSGYHEVQFNGMSLS